VYEVRAFWEDAAVDLGTSSPGGFRYKATRALETFALRRCDAITTICEGLRDDMLQRGLPREKIVVIPNAVDPAEFKFGGSTNAELRRMLGLDGKIVLGFIGSFYAYEGLDLLVRALPAMRAARPEIALLLVGGGPMEAAIKSIAAQNGVSDAIRFVGRVPHREVPDYYGLVDLLVYPRHSQRLTELVTPLKPLEAMARGQIVLASDVGGHRELIRAGERSDVAQAKRTWFVARCHRCRAIRRSCADAVGRRFAVVSSDDIEYMHQEGRHAMGSKVIDLPPRSCLTRGRVCA
jgi:PEP-CTERM/exosortase A-associated glycosyltransferase